MTSLNATPFPLFLTYDEVIAYIGDLPLDDTLVFAGRRVVPAPILAPGRPPRRSTKRSNSRSETTSIL